MPTICSLERYLIDLSKGSTLYNLQIVRDPDGNKLSIHRRKASSYKRHGNGGGRRQRFAVKRQAARISVYASARGSVTLKIVPCSGEELKEAFPLR